MSFDRFYSIIRPHKAASFNTVKRAKITIVSIVIFSLCFNAPFIFTISHQARQCVPDIQGTWKAFYYWLCYVVQFIIPFASLLSMNSTIIHILRTRSKSMISQGHDSNLSQGQDKGQKLKSSEKQILPYCCSWLLVSSSWSLLFTLLIFIVWYLTTLKLLKDLQDFISFTTLSIRCISLIMV